MQIVDKLHEMSNPVYWKKKKKKKKKKKINVRSPNILSRELSNLSQQLTICTKYEGLYSAKIKKHISNFVFIQTVQFSPDICMMRCV